MDGSFGQSKALDSPERDPIGWTNSTHCVLAASDESTNPWQDLALVGQTMVTQVSLSKAFAIFSAVPGNDGAKLCLCHVSVDGGTGPINCTELSGESAPLLSHAQEGPVLLLFFDNASQGSSSRVFVKNSSDRHYVQLAVHFRWSADRLGRGFFCKLLLVPLSDTSIAHTVSKRSHALSR